MASGDAQLISIGRPFIANPDYVTRLENDQPLAELAPIDTCKFRKDDVTPVLVDSCSPL